VQHPSRDYSRERPQKLKRILFSKIFEDTEHRHHAVPMQSTKYGTCKHNTRTILGWQLVSTSKHQRNEWTNFGDFTLWKKLITASCSSTRTDFIVSKKEHHQNWLLSISISCSIAFACVSDNQGSSTEVFYRLADRLCSDSSLEFSHQVTIFLRVVDSWMSSSYWLFS